jgi:hypothetical protein
MLGNVNLGDLAIIGAMTWTAVAIMKHLRVKQYNDALTIVVILVVATLVTFLLAASDFAGPLKGLNAASKILVGYGATSVLRAVYEYKKSLDSTGSAAEPKLVPPASPTPPPA